MDRDGHVARFDSGEDGAVPRRAASGGGAGAPSFDLWPLQAAAMARWIVEDGLTHTAEDRDDRSGAPVERVRGRVLIAYASSKDGYRAALPRCNAELLIPAESRWVLRESEPRIVAARAPLDPSTLRALDAHNELAAIFDERVVIEHWYESSAEGDSGLYAYTHRGIEEGSGAYERTRAPTEPLSIASLDAGTRAALTGLVLPVSFDEAREVQLAEHMRDGECERWGEAPLRYDEEHPKPDGAAIAAQRAQQRAHDRRVLRGMALALVIAVSLIVALARRG